MIRRCSDGPLDHESVRLGLKKGQFFFLDAYPSIFGTSEQLHPMDLPGNDRRPLGETV